MEFFVEMRSRQSGPARVAGRARLHINRPLQAESSLLHCMNSDTNIISQRVFFERVCKPTRAKDKAIFQARHILF